ncbi:MAG: glutathione S-transferase C-terminal domain-containing protein [Myxococcota bacterium]|nr:glutathione S-transferase C-terminal domain-containing protein [Myxococcota bacterium]
MGILIDGVWHDNWYATEEHGGRFVRPDTAFRHTIVDSVGARFAPASGRYHLYVSYACPWAHRVLIARALLGLEDVLSVSCVEPLMLGDGWVFSESYPDHLEHRARMSDVYISAHSEYTGRVTVPVLWDREHRTIVNNESAEILRILNQAMSPLGHGRVDLYPEAHRSEIDAVNALVYPTINDGVYRTGFATSQTAYIDAVRAVFDTLDLLEERLTGRLYLVGDTLTEADIRLFATLIRFDPVYHVHFKCTLRRLVDYPHLFRHTQRIAEHPEIAPTIHLDHVMTHYYGSHPMINPTGVIPPIPSTAIGAF